MSALPTRSELIAYLESLDEEALSLIDQEILSAPTDPPSFASFAQATLSFPLHPWQRDRLSPILERLRSEKGLRILLHKPPQIGGSILVSQRLPAYLIGSDPTTRVGLACYNQTHSEGFGSVVKSIINHPDYPRMFPGVEVDPEAPSGRFSTSQRKEFRDAQPSFLALGLNSGFVGRGVDHLIIDDPYKSADEAASEIVNEKVWRFWSATAEPRISQESNVVVMFHRYHDTDLAGRLLATGDWEHYRFPMEADGEDADASGLPVGTLLSPLRTREWVDKIKVDDPDRWRGQFQGRPFEDDGTLIRPGLAKSILVKDLPDIVAWFRGYDFALEPGKKNDCFSEALLGVGTDGDLYLRDVQWEHLDITQGRDRVLANAKTDPSGTVVCLPKSTADLTVFKDLNRHAEMRNTSIWGVDLKGRNKWQMASGWSARMHNGHLYYVQDPLYPFWPGFKGVCVKFKNLPANFDDPLDALSAAFDGAYPVVDGLSGEKPGPKPFSEADTDQRLGVKPLWEDED